MKTLKNHFLFLLTISFFSSCSMFAAGLEKGKVPYLLDGEMVMEESAIYEAGGFNFRFLNKSDKAIKSFTIVFFLFDEDGNPPLIGSNSVVFEVTCHIGKGELYEDCLSLDNFLWEIPEEPYQVDYLYCSSIEYEDGSQWTDRFGVYAFG